MRLFKLIVCSAMAVATGLGNLSLAQTATKSKYEQVISGKKKPSSERKTLWTLYHTENQLLVEIPKASLGKDYIVITSIAKGISSGDVIGGMSWGFGDDVIWTFRESGNKVFVIQRNVRFRAKKGSPESKAVELSYSDSILYALPVLAKSPAGNPVIDFTRVFMSDDQGIGRAIGPGFRFMSDRSTWAKIKAFEKNIELEVAAVYAGSASIQTVPDSRGVQVNIHYSISELPKVGTNGFKPREADDRVGYFLTVMKDFSDKSEDEHFVRYINRWNLRKRDASVDLSPPKEPIVFYVEKTTPVALRPTIEAGILEWNKAFEKIGFAGAIRVRHEEDLEAELGVDIDPEDVRFNFFRWITADAGFAMGPSRVDPRTGQILDADIIFDAGFLDFWKQDYETFTEEDAHRLNPNWSPGEELLTGPQEFRWAHQGGGAHCRYGKATRQQMGYAAAALMASGSITAEGKLPKTFIHQGLKEVVMHEVGHTLGLRHNFKASTWKSLEEINKLPNNSSEAIVASVMDYSPANLVPKGKPQGPYYSQTIGPYDEWAIEYGYKILTGNESEELKKIAARSSEPGLDYATDEDTRSIDPDPLTNRFDLGKNPMTFVRNRMEHVTSLLPDVVEKSVKEGDGYQKARRAFGLLLSEYWRTANYASRFPGGVYVRRDHKAKNARAPFAIVEAQKQRDAMALINEYVFQSPQYDGQMLNYLAASRWSHWGQRDLTRIDYPIHEIVLRMQRRILSQMLDDITLQRLLDSEYKVAAGEDAYTLAEHMRTIVQGVFSEWSPKEAKVGEYTDRQPFIDGFRRNLQRETLIRLARLVTHGGGPEDARTLARMHLQKLLVQINGLLKKKNLKLDDYTKAHLQDSQSRIKQVLNAELALPAVQ